MFGQNLKMLWALAGPRVQTLNDLKLCFLKLESQGKRVVPFNSDTSITNQVSLHLNW